MKRFLPGRILHLSVATTLAITYFLFQVEPFEDEYRESHPAHMDGWSLSKPTLNWESFDKTNAPKAFVVDPVVPPVLVAIIDRADREIDPLICPARPVRDKSPPAPAL